MGYQTHWLDRHDDISKVDCSNALFITEGQVDANIPLREDARYILHNCEPAKYKPFMQAGHCIILQVYTDDVLPRSVTKIDDFIYYDLADKVIYMPWATDLLPYEIDAIKKELPTIKRNNEVWWVGTIAGGEFGNTREVDPFKRACAESGTKFKHGMTRSMEESTRDIQHSCMAPAIVGTWQQKVGYIPCRIFKNISYGQMGVTNSRHVYELFKGKIVYNPDTYQLFYDAKKRINNMKQEELFELMDFVKNKHTYINRIENLLAFSKLVEKNSQ